MASFESQEECTIKSNFWLSAILAARSRHSVAYSSRGVQIYIIISQDASRLLLLNVRVNGEDSATPVDRLRFRRLISSSRRVLVVSLSPLYEEESRYQRVQYMFISTLNLEKTFPALDDPMLSVIGRDLPCTTVRLM